MMVGACLLIKKMSILLDTHHFIESGKSTTHRNVKISVINPATAFYGKNHN
jgi:hypothetical protein